MGNINKFRNVGKKSHWDNVSPSHTEKNQSGVFKSWNWPFSSLSMWEIGICQSIPTLDSRAQSLTPTSSNILISHYCVCLIRSRSHTDLCPRAVICYHSYTRWSERVLMISPHGINNLGPYLHIHVADRFILFNVHKQASRAMMSRAIITLCLYWRQYYKSGNALFSHLVLEVLK